MFTQNTINQITTSVLKNGAARVRHRDHMSAKDLDTLLFRGCKVHTVIEGDDGKLTTTFIRA